MTQKCKIQFQIGTKQNHPVSHVITNFQYRFTQFNRTLVIADKQTKAIIPPRKNRKEKREFDRQQYRNRNVIERLFAQLKQFRRVATLYDKFASHFSSFVEIVASLLYLK
jgi:transposase